MNAANDRIALDMRRGRALKTPSSNLQGPEKLQATSFKLKLLFLHGIVICVGLTGCKTFRPVEDLTRYYVLSASASAQTGGQSNQTLDIGIAPVEMPGYLQNTRIAVRRGTNEISYSENRKWAEHLNQGIQRVLASDLSALLPSARVITSAWQSGDVKAEVHISIRRFELDESGVATLECEWRILSPGTGGVLRLDHALVSKKGPPLASNATAAVHSLSEALADLSDEIAKTLQSLRLAEAGVAVPCVCADLRSNR